MGHLSVTSPADWSDCLTCAGGRALARKAAIWQRSKGETVAMSAGGELLAVAYLVPRDDGRWEFCLSIRAPARVYMRKLCRFAHLTLCAVAQNRTVVSYVTEGNISGARMARLVGFRPDVGSLWIFDGVRHGAGGEGPFRFGEERQHGPGGG